MNKKEILLKIKKAVKENRPQEMAKLAKKLWGEKGERVIYSDKKHSVDIIYRYRWGYWKGKLQALLIGSLKNKKGKRGKNAT